VSHLIVTRAAARDMQRCHRFLADKAPPAAVRAKAAIQRQLRRLAGMPESGRRFAGDAALRELLIPFGDSGYLALYRYVPADDTVYVLAFRHQKEEGYRV